MYSGAGVMFKTEEENVQVSQNMTDQQLKQLGQDNVTVIETSQGDQRKLLTLQQTLLHSYADVSGNVAATKYEGVQAHRTYIHSERRARGN